MFKHTLALVGLSLITLSANAALYDRGNGLIYDDVLDITWLQDANYAYTSGYAAANDTGLHSGYKSDGRMHYYPAKAWANQLSYGGYDDWRLPSANLMNPTNPCNAKDGSCDTGYNNTTGELGHMFYNNLGNLGKYDSDGNYQSGFGVTNSSFTDGNSGASVSILNLQNGIYRFGEIGYHSGGGSAWTFSNYTGEQTGDRANGFEFYSWAVRDLSLIHISEPTRPY